MSERYAGDHGDLDQASAADRPEEAMSSCSSSDLVPFKWKKKNTVQGNPQLAEELKAMTFKRYRLTSSGPVAEPVTPRPTAPVETEGSEECPNSIKNDAFSATARECKLGGICLRSTWAGNWQACPDSSQKPEGQP